MHVGSSTVRRCSMAETGCRATLWMPPRPSRRVATTASRSRTLRTRGTRTTTTPTTVKATAMCEQGIRLYLQAVAAQVDASAILPGESPGLLRLAATGGGAARHSGSYGRGRRRGDLRRRGRLGLRTGPAGRGGRGDPPLPRRPLRQTQGSPTPATTLGSQVEQRQLQADPQQPGLLGGDGCRVRSGLVWSGQVT